MKLKGTLILFILMSFDLVGQHSYFQEYHDAENTTINDVVEVEDGYVYCGKQQIFGNDELSGILWKTDTNGNTVWQKLIHENDADIFQQIVSNNGELFVIGVSYQQNPATGRVRKLIKFSSEGVKLWEAEFGDSAVAFYDNNLYELLDVKDGMIVASSGYGDANKLTEGELYKLDYDGSILWSKQYCYEPVGENSYDVVLNVKQDEGGYVFLLYSYVSYAPSHEEHIVKVDVNGNEVWRKKVSDYLLSPELAVANTVNTVVNVAPYKDGYIALMQALGEFEEVERTYLMEMDSNGNVWEVTSYLDTIWHESLTMEVNENNEIFVFTTHMPITSLPELALMKFNSDKSLGWYKTYGSDELSEWQMSGILTSDGGALVSGRNFHTLPGELEYDNLSVAKVDCMGNIDWDYLSCSINSSNNPLVFPNPSSGVYHFQFNKVSDAILYIYDLNGRVLQKFSTSDSSVLNLDLSGVSAGVYVYVLEVGSNVYRGNLLKQ